MLQGRAEKELPLTDPSNSASEGDNVDLSESLVQLCVCVCVRACVCVCVCVCVRARVHEIIIGCFVWCRQLRSRVVLCHNWRQVNTYHVPCTLHVMMLLPLIVHVQYEGWCVCAGQCLTSWL